MCAKRQKTTSIVMRSHFTATKMAASRVTLFVCVLLITAIAEAMVCVYDVEKLEKQVGVPEVKCEKGACPKGCTCCKVNGDNYGCCPYGEDVRITALSVATLHTIFLLTSLSGSVLRGQRILLPTGSHMSNKGRRAG